MQVSVAKTGSTIVGRRLALVAGLCLAMFTLPGCAAMYTGLSTKVHFQSTPPGATVTVGDKTGTTPCTISVRKNVKEATITHEDHGERVVALDRDFMWWFLLMDILFTPGYGATGLLVDLPTSAYFRHDSIIHFDLTEPPPLAEGVVQN